MGNSLYVDPDEYFKSNPYYDTGVMQERKRAINCLLESGMSTKDIAKILKFKEQYILELIKLKESEKREEDIFWTNEDGLLCYDYEEFHNREAREVGKQDERKEVISKLFNYGMILEEIAKCLNIPLEEIKRIHEDRYV